MAARARPHRRSRPSPPSLRTTHPVALLALASAIALLSAACTSAPGNALCSGTEFSSRDDGLIGLQRTYDFDFPNVINVDDDLVYLSLDQGGCLFGSIFTTDGRVAVLDLVVLEDDEEFFPPFNASLNVRQQAYDQYPEIADLIAPITEALDQNTIISLNEQVADGASEEEVARQWLEDNDLVGQDDERPLDGARLTVGSKEFTEQNILAYITQYVLEDAGALVDDEIGLIGSAGIRQAILGGDIDMYWEYLGTGWVTYLGNDEGIPDTREQYEAVRDADAENGVVWLPPTPFSNTYALAMTQEQADELGIETISDVAAHLDS